MLSALFYLMADSESILRFIVVCTISLTARGVRQPNHETVNQRRRANRNVTFDTHIFIWRVQELLILHSCVGIRRYSAATIAWKVSTREDNESINLEINGIQYMAMSGQMEKRRENIYDNEISLGIMYFTVALPIHRSVRFVGPVLFGWLLVFLSILSPPIWMSNEIMCVRVNIYTHVYACTINFYYLYVAAFPFFY